MNKDFDSWFWEIDGDKIRSEKFWTAVDLKNKEEILRHLQSAYEMGYNRGKMPHGRN